MTSRDTKENGGKINVKNETATNDVHVSRIDYSKWDNIDTSDDDDDDLDKRNKVKEKAKVQVTRLEQPSRINIGSDGSVSIVKEVEKQSNTNSRSSRENKSSLLITDNSQKHKKSKPDGNIATTDASAASSYIENDKPLEQQSSSFLPMSNQETATDATDMVSNFWTERGGEISNYANKFSTTCWTQDRPSVTIYFSLKNYGNNTKGWQCQIQGALSYKDRHMAIGTDTVVDGGCQNPHLVISWKNMLILDATLSYPVHYAEDDDDETNEVDWSITTRTLSLAEPNTAENINVVVEKFLVVTLYKATPMSGLTIWWSRLFTDTPSIDVSSWSKSSSVGNKNNNGAAFAEVWKKANEEFVKQKSKSKNG